MTPKTANEHKKVKKNTQKRAVIVVFVSSLFIM